MSANETFIVSNPNSPLTYQHLSDINSALRALDVAQNQAETAIRAGIDVSSQIAQIKDQRVKLLQIKNVYFPGQ